MFWETGLDHTVQRNDFHTWCSLHMTGKHLHSCFEYFSHAFNISLSCFQAKSSLSCMCVHVCVYVCVCMWHCPVRQKAKQTAVPVGREAQLDAWLLLTLAKLWQVPAHCLSVSDTRCSVCIYMCMCFVYMGAFACAWVCTCVSQTLQHTHTLLTKSSIKVLVGHRRYVTMSLRHHLCRCIFFI